MQRLFIIVTLVLLASSDVLAGPANIFQRRQVVGLNNQIKGCVIDLTNNHGEDRRFYSEALDTKRDLYVYLPPGYDPNNQYPLMIWLHGLIQDEMAFLELVELFDRAIVAGRLPPMIIGAPDGSIRGRPTLRAAGSFYINSRAGRFEDYIVVDVWNILVSNFSVRPEAEAHILAGGSMGGYGAYNLAIKHRDRFKIVAGFLPPLNMRYLDCRGRYFSKFDPNCIGWEDRYRPHAAIGIFGLITVNQNHILMPLFGRDKNEVVQSISRENPVEMLFTYDVKPEDLSMFIGYGGKDEFNIDAQVESFLFFARKRGIEPFVVFDPKGRHRTETGIKMLPMFAAWLTPQIKSYAPELKLTAPCLE